ncbi:lysophospholipase [Cereibacter ovatus]|uniref:Lysophospholipase n=1 Tax=Cereibacter ovatus TaxID=439529 RepID=A0A285D4B1_9RHOB|nr:alpha/beta hydrolase [Cereibacter ovatus]SNX74630.1 lysophospholipase [Cereibacter ovatus]
MTAAPFHAALADGPPGGHAQWITTSDGVRLRAVLWPEGRHGTVLFFTGRTEYAEKYGPTAAALAAAGFASVAIDWRGQGLSDRATANRLVGHVDDFAQYQHDVAALLALLRDRGLPEPLHLLAHSMGGCIALRALHDGLPVRSVCFSAPMWDIRLPAALRLVASGLAEVARLLGQTHRYVPGTGTRSYVLSTAFDGNVLTSDPEMFGWMQRHLAEVPDLGIAGPSLGWFRAALAETRRLRPLPAPEAVPALCVVGSAEKVVALDEIERRMTDWPQGSLQIVPGAEHELMMERPALRRAFHNAAAAHFRANAGG